jgi:hypothetical protein
MADARSEDSSSRDSSPSDAAPSEDGDGGCTCTPGDAEFFSVASTSLPCFCGVPNRCSTFDDAISCNRPSAGYLVIETYTDCNFVSVRLEGGFVSNRRTYDAATHELVGAANFSDVSEFACGASRVFGLQAGVDPSAAGCHVARREVPCPDGGAEPPPDADRPDADDSFDAEAGPPVSDADAGCACTLSDGGGTGIQSLPCFCAGIFSCPDYDTALRTCTSSPWTGQDGNRIDTYASCNLVVIRSPDGFGSRSFVFDATTHTLVGASRYSDTNEFVCGASRVFGYQAGTFPPASCPLTQSVPRCPDAGGGDDAADGDGGDGVTDGEAG